MLPDIGHRLGAVLRALEEVVIPAIDPANRPAIDQAHLCVAAIRIACEQEPHAYAMTVVELRQYAALAAKLNAIGGNALAPATRARLDAAAAAGWDTLEAPARAELDAALTELRELAQSIVEESEGFADSDRRQAIGAAILTHGAADSLLRRVWLAGSGVEAAATALPSIAEITAPGIARPRG